MILVVCLNPSVDSFWSFDTIKKGTVNRSSRESFFPGGKGIHVAFALNEMKTKVSVLGIWGGMTGKWIKSQCREHEIDANGLSVEDWTRICITNRSKNSWNETELLGAGPTVNTHQTDKFIIKYREQIEAHNFETIVLSGSAPRGFAVDIYKKLVSVAQTFDIPVFVDASGNVLESALEAKPSVVHINRKEGKTLCDEDDPVQIGQWLKKFCEIAAVTDGAKGLFLFSGNKIYRAYHRLDSSEIISTIGAGDCLLAGLCLSMLKKDNPLEWAKYATACGSANCICPRLGMLKAKDVKRILPEVTVEEAIVN